MNWLFTGEDVDVVCKLLAVAPWMTLDLGGIDDKQSWKWWEIWRLWLVIWTDNDIGSEGAKKISESLKINTTLTQLNLGCSWNTTIDKNEL